MGFMNKLMMKAKDPEMQAKAKDFGQKQMAKRKAKSSEHHEDGVVCGDSNLYRNSARGHKSDGPEEQADWEEDFGGEQAEVEEDLKEDESA